MMQHLTTRTVCVLTFEEFIFMSTCDLIGIKHNYMFEAY